MASPLFPAVRIAAVALGGSAGGFKALAGILSRLPAGYPAALLVALHMHPEQTDGHLQWMARHSRLPVKEADDKEAALPGMVYLAPPNYHLLVEPDRSLALSVDRKVQFARPSIDVLFTSAADAYGPELAGVVLTGANSDGAQGLRHIKERGGLAVVQDPDDAEHPDMPRAALAAASPDYVLPLGAIGPLLAELAGQASEEELP